MTHALALHATLPPHGRFAGALAPGKVRYPPMSSARALLASPKGPVLK